MTDVQILTMNTSNGADHYVRITCDGRKTDVAMYRAPYLNRAMFQRDELRHVLLGEPKPNLMDDQYADPKIPTHKEV